MPERRRVEALFHAALELTEAEREAYLKDSCDGETELQQEVASLLRCARGKTEDLVAPLQSGFADLRRELQAGALVGPYRVERKAGAGGMGAVYEATDTRLGRRVALKVVSREVAPTMQPALRFLREAQSAAALSHPNIAVLYDFGGPPDAPWLAMEYIEGSTLRLRLGKPLSEADWERYALQIASAIGHAHARGIVHRDIKPENILLTAEDQVKIIDFGLARTLRIEGGSGRITQASAFIGTVAYAAPELLTGDPATQRSDVYSLGLVLQEMAKGLHRRGMEETIKRCLAHDAGERFSDAGELAAALRKAIEPVPVVALADFQSVEGNQESEWIGTGIAETLAAALAKLGSVRVASRGRVIQELGASANLQRDTDLAVDAGRKLGAQWIVGGRYQRAGERIRVTPAIVDVTTGRVVATDKIDGKLEELFEVQDRVASAVAQALALRLRPTDGEKIMPAETRSLIAYEHYVRGRQRMYRMQGKSLTEAIEHFERATALHDTYALAYSGLGTALALRFIETSDPQCIARAACALERAIELDPELGEPYPWLCNIRLRKNDPEGAFSAARQGVELQPDLAEAQYFNASAFYMAPEFRPGEIRKAPAALREAIRLEPRFHAPWIVLGGSLLFLGKYAEAITAWEESVRLEEEPDLIYRFTGGRTLLAIAYMRMGAWQESLARHRAALQSLEKTDHVYTACFRTLSYCGLGEVELRLGNEKAAVVHYRHARQIINESPRMVGAARLLWRANVGLAAAYGMAGNGARALQLADEAGREVADLARMTATVMFECSVPQLHVCLAATEARLGRLEEAAGHLRQAHASGWMDYQWLSTDPELAPLRDTAEFKRIVEDLLVRDR